MTGLSLLSQDLPIDSLSSDIEEVTILANRLEIPFSEESRSIAIISQREIQAQNALSINELLQTVSGLDLRQRGANGVQADLSIRGGTFEQSLVLIDGVRMTDPQTGHHLMSLPLHLQDIERIEIIKGPAARVYGQNAFAGAVNIVTKMPEEIGANLGLEYGAYNLQNINASVSLPFGAYKQKISAAYRSSDGYRFNSDYQIANVLYQSKINLGNSSLNFKAGHIDREFGANAFYGRETFVDQYETVETTFASAELQSQLGEVKLTPRISYRRNRDNWQFLREDPEFFQNFHTTDVVTAEVHGSRLHKLGALGFGVDYNYLFLNSSNLVDGEGSGEHLRHQVGVHLENRFVLMDGNLDLTPGLMALHLSDFGVSFYPGLDVGYRLSDNFKSFFNLGWTTRIPTFTDLFYEDSGNVGNPNLTEENAFTYEVGLKYQQPAFNVSLSYFDREASDQIDWHRETVDDRWTPDNFSSASYRGLDFNLKAMLSDVPVLDFISVGYTYLNATFEENDFAFSRNQLENLRHQVIINPQFSIGPVALNVVFKYNDRVSLEDYYTINTNLTYSYKEHKIFLRAANLTDQLYRETNLVDMPGRWISGGVNLSF